MANETVADILRKMREGKLSATTVCENCGSEFEQRFKFDGLADRIEAAYKREVGVAKTETTTADATVESVTTCNGLQDSCKQSLQGNAAKLREALKEIEGYAWVHGLWEIEPIAKAALAAPPRNCDKCKNADEAFVLAVDAGVVECDFDAQDMAEFLLAEAEGEGK